MFDRILITSLSLPVTVDVCYTNELFYVFIVQTERFFEFNVKRFRLLFNCLFIKAEYKHVNNEQCIPFANIRTTSQPGAHEEDCHTPCLAGVSATPIVVPLSGTISHFVRGYFDEIWKDNELPGTMNRLDTQCLILGLEHSKKSVRFLK